MRRREFLEQIEHVVRHAVGPRADGQADDLRMRKGRLVELAQPLDRGVGVRRRLEIGDELVEAFVAVPEPADAVVELRQNVLRLRHPAAGAEAAVVAERAAADGHRAIDVGASEAGVEADFLHAAATELLTQKEVIRKVPLARLPASPAAVAATRIC